MRPVLLFVASIFVLAPAVSAQDAPAPPVPAGVMSLHTIVEAALARNPEIKAAEQRLAGMRLRPIQERSLPDPMISAGYNASGWPYPGSGLGKEPTANIGVMVRQDVPYPGKRDLRAAMAGKEADAQEVQVDAARRSVVARVKQAYYRLAYTYAADAVLARNRSLLDTLLKVSETRYGVGQAAQQDVFKAQAELSIIELQAQKLLHERATREAELNLLADRPIGTPVGRPEPLDFAELQPTLESLTTEARERAPMLRSGRLMVERAGVAVQAAQKEYRPDFGVSAGYYNMGSMPPMWELRFDVAVPLRRAKRAAAVGEQAALRLEAERTLDASGRNLEARLADDYHMAATASQLARLYRDSVLPTVRLALDSSITGYQTGKVEFLSVLTNFGSVFEYEMAYFDQLAEFHVAASRLEEMTGFDLAH